MRGSARYLTPAGVLAAVWLAGGCGRFGFDRESTDAPTAGADAGNDAGADASSFVPDVGNCLVAERGPFVDVGMFPTQGGGFGVFSAPPDLLVADMTGGVHNLRFDGSAFTEVGSLSSLGWVEAVWGDGQYVYVGAPGTGLAVIEVASDGRLTLRAQDTTQLREARRGAVSNGVIFVPTGPAGLFAVRFDGTSIAQVAPALPTVSWSSGVWARGSRVLFGDGASFRVLDFDGTSFTDVVPPDARHGGSRVWSDGVTIFVASNAGATAYRVSGATLVELDTFTTAGNARDIWSDGTHVFVAAEAGGIYALAFEADQFSLIDQISPGTSALGVFGDGTYIYANDATGGVHAYAGFRCQSW
ncbi:MAG: hypothetical protein JWP01_497 [Myxococcales bacterium]|nr:hypothetical protein [Myxococcales bacterium]